VTFSTEQENAILEMVVQEVADRIERGLEMTYGKSLGEFVCVPISLAARIAGMSTTNVSRLLPIIKYEGAPNQVQMSDINDYIKKRKEA
jgi:hypothetical protein